MGILGGSASGPGHPYTLPLAVGAPVRIDWAISPGDPFPGTNGWYQGATGLDTATEVGVPADGTKRLNLTLSSPSTSG